MNPREMSKSTSCVDSSLFKNKDAMDWVHVLIELVGSSYPPETTGVLCCAPMHGQESTCLGQAGFGALQLLGHCFPGLGRVHGERLKGQSKALRSWDSVISVFVCPGDSWHHQNLSETQCQQSSSRLSQAAGDVLLCEPSML